METPKLDVKKVIEQAISEKQFRNLFRAVVDRAQTASIATLFDAKNDGVSLYHALGRIYNPGYAFLRGLGLVGRGNRTTTASGENLE